MCIRDSIYTLLATVFTCAHRYLVVKQFASPEQCAALLQRMDELVDKWDPEKEISVFTTDRQTRTTGMLLCRKSRCFWAFVGSVRAGVRGSD